MKIHNITPKLSLSKLSDHFSKYTKQVQVKITEDCENLFSAIIEINDSKSAEKAHKELLNKYKTKFHNFNQSKWQVTIKKV